MILKKINKEVERLKKKLFYSGPKHRLREEMQYQQDNLPYEQYDQTGHGKEDIQIPHIKSIDETLDKIVHEKCSISRFGDGEIACMNRSRIAFHDASDELAERLKEVLSTDLPQLLIGLPDCFGALDCYVPYTQKFWRKWMSKKRQMAYSYLDMDRVYYNAFFNRFYLNFIKSDEQYRKCCSYAEKLKTIWKDRDVVLLEGCESRLGVGSDLFDGAKSISRILFAPKRNSFKKYAQILSAFDDVDTEALILVSLGPTATVLAYDLCKKGYQAIDFGHFSEEYECFLRKVTPMESKEAGGDCQLKYTADPNDPEYKKQIIKVIE